MMGDERVRCGGQAAETRMRGDFLRRGLGWSRMTISMSQPRRPRKCIRRSTEKPSRRKRESAEILGWLMRRWRAARDWERRRAARMRLMATASRTLVCFSWALGRRRSAKTLPELLMMGILLLFFGLAFFGMACLMFGAGCVQSLRD